MHSYDERAVKYMRKRGVTHLKYYIGTHAHRDHVGGAAPILAAFDVDLVVVPHSGVSSLIRQEAVGAAEKAAVKAARYHVMKRNEVICLGEARFTCVGPVKIVSRSYRDVGENVNSLVLNVRYGSNTFLLTGDATGEELAQVQKASPGCMQAQVLKNPHHNGGLKAVIGYCKPIITVFSTDSSHLPSGDFIRYIKKQGSEFYITASNRNGHVTIYSDGENLTVQTQK